MFDVAQYWRSTGSADEISANDAQAALTDEQIIERIQEDDDGALQQFVLRKVGLVLKAAGAQEHRLRVRPALEFEDLVQAGVIGLMQAARRWDNTPESGSIAFSTFAWRHYITPEILRELRRGYYLWIPNQNNRIWRTAHEIEKARGERGAFTVDELVEFTGARRETVEATLAAGKTARSLDDLLDVENEDGKQKDRELIFDEDTRRATWKLPDVYRPTEAEALDKIYYEQTLAKITDLLDGLPDSGVNLGDEISAEIMRLCLGLHGGEPMHASAAGKRVANLTPAPACKRFRVTREYLRERLADDDTGGYMSSFTFTGPEGRFTDGLLLQEIIAAYPDLDGRASVSGRKYGSEVVITAPDNFDRASFVPIVDAHQPIVEYRVSNPPAINAALLDQELLSALGGSLYHGLSTDGEGVRLHLVGAAQADKDQAYGIVMAHDATGKSEADLANERRAAAIARLEALDLTAITGQVEAASAGDDLRPQLLELSRTLEDVLEVLGYGAEPKS